MLPEYFKTGKIASFQRQLCFYGFLKSRSDPDLQVNTDCVRFSHEYFQKGRPELLFKIVRSTAKPRQQDNESGSAFGETDDRVKSLQEQIVNLQQQLKTTEEERTIPKKFEPKVLSNKLNSETIMVQR